MTRVLWRAGGPARRRGSNISFRYYRFRPTGLRTPGTAETQISEFAILYGSTRLTGMTASAVPGSSPVGEEPSKAADDSVSTKWLNLTGLPTTLIYDFGSAVAATGYRWATANDNTDRDPVSWVVEGSSNNTTWYELDSKTAYATTTSRDTFLPDFAFAGISQAPTVAFQQGFSAGDLPGLSSTELNQRLDAMASLGCNNVRFDIAWPSVQPTNSSTYSWTNYDNLVTAVHARGWTCMMIIDYTPSWARSGGDTSTPPTSNSTFATYAAAVVNRYVPLGVTQYEIWNEPNGGFWTPAPSPTAYTNLLIAAANAMRAAQPTVEIIAGVMAPATTGEGPGFYSMQDFMAGMYTAGAKPYFDAIACHPYSFPATPSDTDEGWAGWQQMNAVRTHMVSNGDSAKPIYATEYGATTVGNGGAQATVADRQYANGPDHVDEGLQALTFSDAYTVGKSTTWLRGIWCYALQDFTDRTGSESAFGITNADGSAKLAAEAWRADFEGDRSTEYTVFMVQRDAPTINTGTTAARERGVKFQVSVACTAVGVRFYKSSADTGTRTVSLWSTGGTRLATASVAGDSTSGWQRTNFTTPYVMTANTTYIAAVHKPAGGGFAENTSQLTVAKKQGPITILATGVDGANSVYAASSTSVLPTTSAAGTNYWVDPVVTVV